jgi:hypothetical protein
LPHDGLAKPASIVAGPTGKSRTDFPMENQPRSGAGEACVLELPGGPVILK